MFPHDVFSDSLLLRELDAQPHCRKSLSPSLRSGTGGADESQDLGKATLDRAGHRVPPRSLLRRVHVSSVLSRCDRGVCVECQQRQRGAAHGLITVSQGQVWRVRQPEQVIILSRGAIDLLLALPVMINSMR